jgi:hypothetical protein
MSASAAVNDVSPDGLLIRFYEGQGEGNLPGFNNIEILGPNCMSLDRRGLLRGLMPPESTTTRAALELGHGWALHIPTRRGWLLTGSRRLPGARTI